jgi:hypothetical protein
MMFYFNPHTDSCCLFLENYLLGHPVKFELVNLIKTFSAQAIYAVSPQGETRLLYLMRRLQSYHQLDVSIDLIQLLLWRSNQFPSAFNTMQFLLWHPDEALESAYRFGVLSSSRGLTALLHVTVEQSVQHRTELFFKDMLRPVVELSGINLLLMQLYFLYQMREARHITCETYRQSILGTESDRRTIFLDNNPIFVQSYLQRIRHAFEQNYLTYSECEALFQTKNFNGYCLLDALLYPGDPAYGFGMLFDFLSEAYRKNWVSESVYTQILTEPVSFTRSLLHELIMHGDVDNYMRYLHAIDALYQTGQLTEDGYLSIFRQKNKAGYSGVHQSLNAPNFAIAEAFLAWFKRNEALLSNDARHGLLCLRSVKNGTYPKRVLSDKYINDDVDVLRQALCSPRLSVFVELAKGNTLSASNSRPCIKPGCTVVTSPDDVRATSTMSPGGI